MIHRSVRSVLLRAFSGPCSSAVSSPPGRAGRRSRRPLQEGRRTAGTREIRRRHRRVRRGDQADAQRGRPLLLSRQRLFAQGRRGTGLGRLQPGPAPRSQADRRLHQPRRHVLRPRPIRRRHRQLQPGPGAESQADRRADQPWFHLRRDGALRSRHRRLHPGHAHQSPGGRRLRQAGGRPTATKARTTRPWPTSRWPCG